MQDPWEWTEQDVLALINDGIQESLVLDYKRSDSLGKTDRHKREISKDVSAFANSAGGTIVYGVIEKNHLPQSIDEGCGEDINREWIENVINSNIQRRIDGVRITPIELSTHPGRHIYVIWIPQSKRAPHMANDNRFYKRFNFQSVPMEEYEVRDVSRRLDSPDLNISLELKNPQDNLVDLNVSLNGIVKNASQVPAEYYVVMLFIDSRLKIRNSEGLTEYPRTSATVGDVNVEVSVLGKNFIPSNSMPLFEGVRFNLFKNLQVSLPMADDFAYMLGSQIMAPLMGTRQFWSALVVSDGIVDIDPISFGKDIVFSVSVEPGQEEYFLEEGSELG
jgi:hypothetical protein